MRRKLITILLLLTWFCQLSGRYFVMLEFYVSQQYIAANLCENRDKPKLHCNGKCHLRKQLSAEEKRSEENPERRAEHKSEVFHAGNHLDITFQAATFHEQQHFKIPITIGSPVDQPTAVFHPPAMA
ncbi:MAG: hypothetical protein JO154_08800 [Chitinophaga sp.]|uniref:hypothetical protein n=1 Tax=Chitinophaga sp. TaxID=1869181 RepID=UPI0025BC7078|nr:hypothetical protein [Chitinophaga sp.]MBV8252693.1 hypothetical protein [Chitinophaga sp.]